MDLLNRGAEDVPIASLRQHPRNANRGHEESIEESISTTGFYGRVIVNRRTGYIVAGNHRYKVAQKLGMERIPVEWIDVDEDTELRILLADNRTGRLGADDPEALVSLLQELRDGEKSLQGTGYTAGDIETLVGILETTSEQTVLPEEEPLPPYHKRNTSSPVYEPKGEQPAVWELSNRQKTEALLTEIQEHDLPEDVEQFLKVAAFRHTVFDYAKIAEYYCHAPAEVQRLMEKSALVVIDFESAIHNGFVELCKEIKAILHEKESAQVTVIPEVPGPKAEDDDD